MAKERRDSKNRLLWNGEYQKSDGRYEYRYLDAKGVSRSVYSWTLTQTDRPPKGKQSEMCLREMEKQIERDMQDEIDSFSAQRTSLNDFFDVYIEGKQELKQSTRTNYKYMYRKYVSDTLGKRALKSIKYSDVKKFYNSLIREQGLSLTAWRSFTRSYTLYLRLRYEMDLSVLIQPKVLWQRSRKVTIGKSLNAMR